MLALVLKLTLAPGLVASATYAARRLGPRAAGLLSGIPVVAGPVVLIYAVEQGDGFAATAAAAAVLGLASSVAFCVAYAAAARRYPVGGALVSGSLAFALMTAVFASVHPPLALSAGVSGASLCIGIALIRRLRLVASPAPPRADLLGWRLAITAALVITLTTVAHGLSAHLAGLLVPLPIITAVMAGFTHARDGRAAAIDLLAGLTEALTSFLLFFLVLASLLARAPSVVAFSAAALAAAAVMAVLVGGQQLRIRARADLAPAHKHLASTQPRGDCG